MTSVSSILKMPVIPQIPFDVANDKKGGGGVSLDISGVAGFFGGDVAVKAMSTVHVYAGRRWLGWYNSPGSYEVAKQYGQLARSRFWDGLYPGPNLEPAELFELDKDKGPRYRDIRSGTTMRKTSHLAHLFTEECKELTVDPGFTSSQDRFRKTLPVDVIIATLNHQPPVSMEPSVMTGTARAQTSLIAHIPILVSFATCILSALYGDWISFSMILVGILSNGISCAWIGSGTLTFTHPNPAAGSPQALGILNDDEHIIILQGPEGAVNSVTRGKFSLRFHCSDQYHRIGLCSLLLTAQFLAQLLLLPQGQVFGQIMFLTSLAVSWMYNSYLASLDRTRVQRSILVHNILKSPTLTKYTLGTRTASAVFALLVLSDATLPPPGSPPMPMPAGNLSEGGFYDDKASDTTMSPNGHDAHEQTLRRVLDDLLPNDTAIWRAWKAGILKHIHNYHSDPRLAKRFAFPTVSTTMKTPLEDLALLSTLDGDADAAVHAYRYFRSQPDVSSAHSGCGSPLPSSAQPATDWPSRLTLGLWGSQHRYAPVKGGGHQSQLKPLFLGSRRTL